MWLALALVAALILAPVFLALMRPAPARGRVEAMINRLKALEQQG